MDGGPNDRFYVLWVTKFNLKVYLLFIKKSIHTGLITYVGHKKKRFRPFGWTYWCRRTRSRRVERGVWVCLPGTFLG